MIPLTLAEQFLLLALDDESGKLLPLPDRALDYALSGAILADLTRVGRIRVSEDKVIIVDPAPVDSVPEDICLKDLVESEVESLQGCLSQLAGDAHGLRRRIISQLVSKGVLKEEDKDFLWVFHISRYPLADPTAESAVRQRIRNQIRKEGVPLTETDHVLISLIHVCQMENLILSEEDQKTYAARIEEISRNDRIGKAVADCLEEIQKALMEIRTYAGM